MGGDAELQPLQRIAAVGYSFRAMEADTADFARSSAAGSDGDWTIAGDDMHSAVSGNVGIGTTSPTALLEVAGDVRIGDELQVPTLRGAGQVSMTFMQTMESPNTPVPIHDNYPPGDIDIISFPDWGTAENLIVSVDISNSDISGIEVSLTDPNSNGYLLYDGDSTGTRLLESYPYPTPTISGDLTSWTGQNPQGDWELKVVDSHFLNNTIDGQINSWSISVTTATGDVVRISNGNFIVDDKIGIGTTSPTAELEISGDIMLQNGVAIDEFSTDNTLGDNSDSAVPTERAVRTYVNSLVGGAGAVPIGSVTAWMKSYPNTPPLPNGWVECNGSTLNDSSSPYHGQVLPNLNGTTAVSYTHLRAHET